MQVHAGLRGAIAYVLISMLNSKEQQNQLNNEKHHSSVHVNQQNNLLYNSTTWRRLAHAFVPHRLNLTEEIAPLVTLPTFRLLQTTTLITIVVTIFLMVFFFEFFFIIINIHFFAIMQFNMRCHRLNNWWPQSFTLIHDNCIPVDNN